MQAITDIIVNERDFPTNLQISNNITNSQKTSSFSFEDVLSFVKNEMQKTESVDSSSVKEKTESVKPEKQTDISEKIAEIMGQHPAQGSTRMRAQVMCSGTNDLARHKFQYDGLLDCVSVSRIGGGDKECPYGCLGYGTCVKACPFGAIKVENGVAVVEYEKCVGCGLCVNACPKHIIHLVPFSNQYWVGCESRDNGKTVRSYCQIGCIGCGICQRNCPTDAIKVVNGLAEIDYDRCIQCGTCFEKCPRSTIWFGEFQIKEGDTRK